MASNNIVAVGSGIARLYLAWLVVVLVLLPHAALAQAPITNPVSSPRVTTTLPQRALTDLPTSNNVFGLLDAAQPEIIADRLDTGGLSTGDPARLTAHSGSWTQTLFRVGSEAITDPDGSGTPLLLPDLVTWDRIDITTSGLPLDTNAPGLTITLQPRRPADSWQRLVEGVVAPVGFLTPAEPTIPPPIARLGSWTDVSVFAGGPLALGRVGLTLAGSWTKSSRFERDNPASFDGSLASLFAGLELTSDAADHVRALTWIERARMPHDGLTAFGTPPAAQHATSFHVQGTWDSQMGERATATFLASYSSRTRSPDTPPSSSIVVDRLEDGPVPELLNPMNGTDRTWSVGGRFKPSLANLFGRPQNLVAGVDVSGGTTSQRQPFIGTIGELVDGIPARVWEYADPGRDSQSSGTPLSLYAGDTVAPFPRTTIGAGIRYEAVGGSANGAVNDVSWHNWLPRASVRWQLPAVDNVLLFADYGRYGYRLPSSYLAYGDPAAPIANVYRWIGATDDHPPPPAQIGELIARVGPGTGGDPSFSAIDPNLQRPVMDDVKLGVEMRLHRSTVVRATGINRREQQLAAATNIGVPITSYSVVLVPDPGIDLIGKQDDRVLSIFNRLPASFGKDRYLLTNPAGNDATFVGIDVTSETTTDRIYLMIGGTAGRSSGPAANRGYRATENDEGAIGELFTTPNAETNARGHLFGDRSYTLKASLTYRFSHDVRAGLIARYQDGQPFARMVVVPDLNQGAEAVRAFPNGESRFTYTATLDVRLQKGFVVGPTHIDAIADVFNLLNSSNEVEEVVVTGPSYRLPSAVQPPRVLHVGLRVRF